MTDLTRIQVRVSPEAGAWLGDRAGRMQTGSHHEQARAELAMWRDALAAELRRIRLTRAQASCLADVLNGTLIQPGIGRLVYAEVADAFMLANDGPVPGYSSYGKKWGIDEQALLEYLLRLGPTADHALLDAFSRWWALDGEATVEGFAEVGLMVADEAGDGEQDGG